MKISKFSELYVDINECVMHVMEKLNKERLYIEIFLVKRQSICSRLWSMYLSFFLFKLFSTLLLVELYISSYSIEIYRVTHSNYNENQMEYSKEIM